MRDDLLLLLLRAASGVAERINAQVVAAGHDRLRPAHGLAFVRLSGAGATTAELAEFLGMTKQSASALVEQLEDWGYVERVEHPSDRRARLVVLTGRGVDVTRAADRAAGQVWDDLVDAQGRRFTQTLAEGLETLAAGHRLRRVW